MAVGEQVLVAGYGREALDLLRPHCERPVTYAQQTKPRCGC
jgi:hypothetical protein